MFKSKTSVPQSSPSLGMPTHKFVEGTVYQLARVLYAVHRDNESQPADAIHEAIKTFGDDLDRNTILQSARISAEALNRKKPLLFKTQKTATTLTVFEQAESLKKSRIASMDRELVNMHEAALVHEDTEGSAEQDTLALWAEYNERHDIRSGLKQEVRDAIYSDEEISLATQRLQRIEQIDNRRGEAVDTTAAQMKNVWRQLVQALLLQKSRGHGDPLITFENTPSASKEPIARVSRTECGKLNRLSLQEGELYVHLLRAVELKSATVIGFAHTTHQQPPQIEQLKRKSTPCRARLMKTSILVSSLSLQEHCPSALLTCGQT